MIEAQFPDLAPAELASLGDGWDNSAYRVNQRWVFRFPRRQLGAQLIATEAQVLPRLAPKLPLRIPTPRFFGRAQGAYPYDFLGYGLVEGRTACAVRLSAHDRLGAAHELGAFLRALHRVDLGPSVQGPLDELERTNLAKRLTMILDYLSRVEALEPAIDVGGLEEQARELARTEPWAEAPVWVHGDLYGRHLVVDEERRVCGVIDWGDVHRGDPALDLALGYSFFPPEAREAFFEAYGEVAPQTRRRARFRAMLSGVILVAFGHDRQDRDAIALGLDALTWVRA